MSSIELDRVTPTRRPHGAPAGYQSWRNLLFVHVALPPEIVRPLVPASLDLDLWEGKAHVGFVPFEMKDIRAVIMPKVAALNFLETNVRTYVHHKGEPGVYFFSLEASSWLAVRAARIGWGLPYFHATMSSGEGAYRTVRKNTGETLEAEWKLGEMLGPSTLGTYEYFVLERYLLFSEHRGRLKKGQVHHVPYPAQRVTLERFSQTLFPTNADPYAAHFSPGVDVEVFGPWTI
jgi:uncharacterized protein YqjF (DUF2071 family)